MSVPEWMLKFQKIGQKGGEEVTSINDTGGVATSVDPERERPANTVVGSSVDGSSVSSVTHLAPEKTESSKEEPSKFETKEEEGGGNDAAATVDEKDDQTDKKESSQDDAAALLSNTGKTDEEGPNDEPGQINLVMVDEAGPGDEHGQIGGGESTAEASKGEETKKEEEVDNAAAAQEEGSTKEDSEPKKEEVDVTAILFAAESKKQGEDATSQEESKKVEEAATVPVSEGDTPIDADQQQSAGEAGSALSPEEDESAAASAAVMQSEAGDIATEGENVMSADGTTTATPEGEDDVDVFDPMGAPSDEEALLDGEEEIWDEDLEEEVIDEEVYFDENGDVIEEDLDENGYEEVVEEQVVAGEEEIDPSDNLPSAASMFGAQAQDPPADTFDIENQDKVIEKEPKEKTKFNPYIAVCACLAVIAAVVVIVLYTVLDIDEEDTPRAVVVQVVPPTPSPTNMPTAMLDPEIVDQGPGVEASEATTSLDPMLSDGCDFTGLVQPNIFDQCRCGGQIILLAEDVRTRYSDLVKNFIPSVPGGYDGTISSCTPRNQALVWLSTGINNGGEIESARIQRFAMSEFFYEQEGLTWTDSTDWLSTRSVCSWYGITCNTDRVVAKIELDANNISGQLSGAVGTMTMLGGFDTFSVSKNAIVGTIPPALFAAGIQSIDLSENAFFGAFPPMSDALINLNVERNNLSGPLTEIGKAVSVATVKIAYNSFNGRLPATLFPPTLQEMDLGNNFLSGTIPSEISQATLLKSLTLGPNKFTGSLQSNINALTNLESLSVYKIPDLDGRLPASFGLALTNLVTLIISETLVRGNIPSFFGGLTKLETLDLSSNLLRSELPTELGLLIGLTTLHLDNNGFFGPIPVELGLLTGLTELLLNDNAITGSIPSELGGLADLKNLTLDGNAFGGERAPNEVCSLRGDDLVEFTVDCTVRVGTAIAGVICGVPTCCTSCRQPLGVPFRN